MKIRGFFITMLLSSAGLALASPGVDLHSFQDVEKFLTANPSSSMEDVISRLSPELRSNYQLVYESRSAIKGSPKSPRVILSNSDRTRVIAFGGDAKLPGGNQMEFMELNPKTKKLDFRMVEFGAAKAEVHSNPATCVACHASKGLQGKVMLRPIWDTYPDWPGVYGSSHNNIIMNREGLGTSSIVDLHFEAKNFNEFKKSAATHSRYQHLIGLNEMTLPKLAEIGTQFSDRLIGLNHESTDAYIREAIADIRKNPSAQFRLRKQEEIDLIMNQYSPVHPPKTFSAKEVAQLKAQFEEDLKGRNARQWSHYQSKLERMKKIILKHTDSDRDVSVVAEMHLKTRDPHLLDRYPNQMQAFSVVKNPGEDSALRLERLLKALDLDPGASSIAFEPFTSVGAPGAYSNLGDYVFQTKARMVEKLHEDLAAHPLVSEAEIRAIPKSRGICAIKPVEFIKTLFRRSR